MYATQSDVIVHLGEPVNDEDRARLEHALEAEHGIARARSNPRAGQLLIVNFDPTAISALGVLRSVHAQGYTGRLVGM